MHDGFYGTFIQNWQASPDSGDIRLFSGRLELGYAAGSYSAVANLGNVYAIHNNFGSSISSIDSVQGAASSFYSLRTNPELCGGPLSGPMLPLPSTGGCRTEMAEALDGINVWSEMQSSFYTQLQVMTQDTKSFSPLSGDVYLVRIGSSSTQDELYSKILFTEIVRGSIADGNSTVEGITSLSFRWSNLYNRQSGASYCDMSAFSPSLLTEVAWSNFYGPASFTNYDDSWVAALFIIFLIALIIMTAMIAGVAYWVRAIGKDQLALMQRLQRAPQPGAAARPANAATGNADGQDGTEMATAVDFL